MTSAASPRRRLGRPRLRTRATEVVDTESDQREERTLPKGCGASQPYLGRRVSRPYRKRLRTTGVTHVGDRFAGASLVCVALCWNCDGDPVARCLSVLAFT